VRRRSEAARGPARPAGTASAQTAAAQTAAAQTALAEPVDCGPPLRADARRNRDLILAAADEAFADEGLGVPVDEIARRAGVGAGTLYRHFPTKEALFEAVLVAHMDRLACYGRGLASSDRPDEALFEFVRGLASEATSKRSLVEALSGAGYDIKATSLEAKTDLEEAFQNLLSRAQSAGLVRPDVQVADLMGLVMGTCALAADERTDCSQSRMLAVVFAGLRTEPAAATER
jgi:AcrR family transcriptional regulator